MVRAEHEPADRGDRRTRGSAPARRVGGEWMLSWGARAAVLAIALGLALSGCGISDPYTTSRRSSSTVRSSSHKASVPDDDGPSPPHTTATPDAVASTPQIALARYATLYVNWTRRHAIRRRAAARVALERPGPRAGARGGQPPRAGRGPIRRVQHRERGGNRRGPGDGARPLGRRHGRADERIRALPGPAGDEPCHLGDGCARVARGWVVSGWYPGS